LGIDFFAFLFLYLSENKEIDFEFKSRGQNLSVSAKSTISTPANVTTYIKLNFFT